MLDNRPRNVKGLEARPTTALKPKRSTQRMEGLEEQRVQIN
jgi:hypothetical protein